MLLGAESSMFVSRSVSGHHKVSGSIRALPRCTRLF